jgi:uncharacterized membrane protein
MSDFSYVVEIQAPAAHVWSVLLDVERWPQWTKSVTSVKRMDIGPLTLGSRTRIVQPRLAPAVWKVTSLDLEKRIFAWTTRGLGVVVVGMHHVEAVADASRVTLWLEYSGLLSPLMARVLSRLNLEYLKMEGDGLKRYCESATPADAEYGTRLA